MSTRPVRVVGVLTFCLAFLVASAPVLAAPAPDPTEGISSGGDPYYPLDGNRGYEVDHYRIVDRYDPATDRLHGSTALRVTATDDLSRLSLDLVLRVDGVQVDHRRADFTKPQPHELHVTLPTPVTAGESFKVKVRYHGRPGSVTAEGARPGRDLYFHRPGETVAMGEPQNGAWWFAANETPQDKASYDITIRVPRGQQAVSNGAFAGRTISGRRWVGWQWVADGPMATYMAFFAAGHLRLVEDVVEGMTYWYGVSTRLSLEDQETALRRLRTTTDLENWLAGVLGEHAFRESGGVVPGIPAGYALETATRPVYPWSSARSSAGWESLMVHELAHQWFGDAVSVSLWRDVWLNEGFATYAEWWYAEEHGGPTVADRLAHTYDSVPADSKFWDVRVSDPGTAQMWSSPVYDRGAMTLAALRNRIGDDGLATLLRRWYEVHSGGNGTGEELRSLAEEVSGEELDGFFQHWLDDTRKPAATAENGLG